MKTKPKTMSASKQARIGRDLAGDFVILISGFFMHDLMLTARRMLQEKLKFGTPPTFDRNGLGNASAIAQIFGIERRKNNHSRRSRLRN
jgi:hypothetical protein